MATLKQRLHRKSESGSYDVVHLESDATVIKINSDDAETKTVADYLPKIQDTDDTPTDINPGQIIVGQTKVWFCGGDGETYELTSQGGGSWFPSYGKNFTYTGEYVIVPENDTDWKVKFLTSGTFTATDALLIDVFAVGGGGSGGMDIGGVSSSSLCAGSGGGGGYTTTQKSVYLEKDKSYDIVIGSGGSAPDGSSYESAGGYNGNNGGSTSGFNVTANGGFGGKMSGNTSYATSYAGGNGGSGGGGCDTNRGYNGGSDGSNGSCGSYNTKGTGQGTTTREFGESAGDLYSGGGGAGAGRSVYSAGAGGEGGGGSGVSAGTTCAGSDIDGTANTGGGGGGNHVTQFSGGLEYDFPAAGKGGSGILIIRNHRE